MGDFNVKVGTNKVSVITGGFGFGELNPRGESLIDFCRIEDYVIKNIFYRLHTRQLYTWKSPQDARGKIVRNQIAYILVNPQLQNSITKVTTYPGADIGSEHNPLVANICIKFKRMQPNVVTSKLFDTQKLKNKQFEDKFIQKMEESLPTIEEIQDDNIESALEKIRDQALQLAKSEIGNIMRPKFKPWMTENIMQKMELRRIVKLRHMTVEYRNIHKEIRINVKEAKSKWVNEQCEEAKQLLERHDTFNFHKKIKTMTRRFKKRNLTAVRDDTG
ncbi:hypothetical protein PGB90_001571 [Kerria lacca]